VTLGASRQSRERACRRRSTSRSLQGTRQAEFCYVGPTSLGAEAITAFADTDNDGTHDPGEPIGAATKAWVAGAPATLTLDPAADGNPVDSEHCLTATLRDAFLNPVSGVTVRFEVRRLPLPGSVVASGPATTDAQEQAKFCYVGPALPAEDLITAFADTDDDGIQDDDEPAGAATRRGCCR
jgi:hypothetical protein